MFRASPWISYQPAESRNKHRVPSDPIKTTTVDNHMDKDVDMDTPHISTLPEEQSPPPQPTRTSKFRVKLLVNDAKAAPSSPGSASTPRKSSTGAWEENDADADEDEEDQLMDDDDQLNPSSPPKRRPSSGKRKPKKADKRVVDEKARDKAPDSPLKQDTPPNDSSSHNPAWDIPAPPEPSNTKIPSKRAPPSRSSAPQRAKGKAIARVAKELAIPNLEDGNISESYTGTAASSPAAFHPDGSPEPETYGPIPSAPSTEDINLDSIPLPIYPLPQRPFAVQPPPKIGTGFASVIPLDKSRKHPRHWRVANREIRGIAGGRWFARTWVGEKDSEFASAVAANASGGKSADGMALPKLSSVSIAGISSAKKLKSSAGSASHSRASSTMPDRDRDSRPTRAPTRMRSSVVAGPVSEGGNDSDVAVAGP